jgi:hypothetical protein
MLVYILVRLGDAGRAEQIPAGFGDQDRERGEIRTAAAALRLTQDDPRAATAALAPVLAGSDSALPWGWLPHAFLRLGESAVQPVGRPLMTHARCRAHYKYATLVDLETGMITSIRQRLDIIRRPRPGVLHQRGAHDPTSRRSSVWHPRGPAGTRSRPTRRDRYGSPLISPAVPWSRSQPGHRRRQHVQRARAHAARTGYGEPIRAACCQLPPPISTVR